MKKKPNSKQNSLNKPQGKVKASPKHFYLIEPQETLKAKNQLLNFSQKDYFFNYEEEIKERKHFSVQKKTLQKALKQNAKSTSCEKYQNNLLSKIDQKNLNLRVNRKLIKSASENEANRTISKIYEIQDLDEPFQQKPKTTWIRKKIQQNIITLNPFIQVIRQKKINKNNSLKFNPQEKKEKTHIRKGRWRNSKISTNFVCRVYEFNEESNKFFSN